MTRKFDKVLLIILSIPVLLATLLGLAYSFVSYPASEEVLDDLEDVTSTPLYDCFTYPRPLATIAMYPGAFVDSLAYAPLAAKLREARIEVYLLRIPLNFSLLTVQAAESVRMVRHENSPFYVMGHSLGGVAASLYASSHLDEVDGVIMLASYPSESLTETSLNYLSIYGSLDSVLDEEAYNSAKELWPSSSHEVIIAEGNHAQFGNYGEQQGDTPATITCDEQITQTVAAIVEFLQNPPTTNII